MEAIGAMQSGQDSLELLIMVPQYLPHILLRAAGLDSFAGHGFDAGLEVREGWARFEDFVFRNVEV
jgi:hypothetical protein